jgi:hypothetical protein
MGRLSFPVERMPDKIVEALGGDSPKALPDQRDDAAFPNRKKPRLTPPD